MNDFNAVSYKTYIYKKSFVGSGLKAKKVSFESTGINAGSAIPVKFYDVDGKTYVYCADKALYKAENNAFSALGFTSDTAPLVLNATIGGARTLLIIGSGGARAGENAVSGIPFGSSCAFFAGRLFISDGRFIKYSGEFDFTDFTVGLSFGGFMQTEYEDGKILYLAPVGGKLFVVCEHSVYAVTAYGAPFEFSMEKVSAFRLDAAENTVLNVGNRICFLSGGRLCVLVDGKIKTAGSALDGLNFTVNGYAGARGGRYFLPLVSGETNYVYAFDTVSGEETLAETDGYSVTGGYAVRESDGAVFALSLNSVADGVAYAYSGEYDFGTCRKKAICRVEAHISGYADLSVCGFGNYRATLTEKCNSASCFVHGKTFTIAFENASEDFKLYDLAVTYIIYGE